MDREGPDETTPGQGAPEDAPAPGPATAETGAPVAAEADDPAAAAADDSVAADTSGRVASVLADAERDAAAIREGAEREAEGIAESARGEGRGAAQAAHSAAQAVARERAERLSALRASIAARAGSLTEGLEGGELTKLRLDQLVEILGHVEDRIMREVALGPDGREMAADSAGERSPAAPAAPTDGATSPEGATPPDTARRYEGEMPEGAPMMRMPSRSADPAADARYCAVLMAIEGRDRSEIDERLRSQYGGDGWDELLDELFGPSDVRA